MGDSLLWTRRLLPMVVVALAAAPADAQLGADGNQVLWDVSPELGGSFGFSLAVGDFDHDGFSDLAVGVPAADVEHDGSTVVDAGAVQVYYGSAGGLLSGSPVRFDLGAILAGTSSQHPETGDGFGHALGSGDLNGDTYDDLAIGAPFQNAIGIDDCGGVWLLYGGPGGLAQGTGSLLLGTHQGGPNSDVSESDDYFGRSLANGDFNDDGYDDIAVGVPGEDIGSIEDAGAVQILFGDPVYGHRLFDDQFWHQNSPDTQGGAEPADEFGRALAAADFNGDGVDDLAVGIPFEDLGTAVIVAGAVHVLYGTGPVGLTATGDQIWTQNSHGILDNAEDFDRFGWAVAASDHDGDGADDLAVGVSSEEIAGAAGAGAVNVIRGSVGGLSAAGNQFWHQSIPGTHGGAEPGDRFGWALAACDFDGSGHADLAVGIPVEDLGAVIPAAGAIHVFYSGVGVLGSAGNAVWHQNQPGVIGNADPDDAFGSALACGDFNGDGADDLAIGITGESLGGLVGCGSVQILYGVPGVFFDGFESGTLSAWSGAAP
jgi:hypothetical protein